MLLDEGLLRTYRSVAQIWMQEEKMFKFVFKTILVASLIAFGATFACAAGFEGPGAHSTLTRALDVHHAPGETPCVLEGRILEKIKNRKDHYLFADKSGQVIVEIKRRVFGDMTVTPNDLVRISGAVETDGRYPKELEVESMSIVGKAEQTAN